MTKIATKLEPRDPRSLARPKPGVSNALHSAICHLVGKKAQAIRIAGGWNQGQVALAADITVSTLTSFENGRALTATTLYKVAAALGVEATTLLPSSAEVLDEMGDA